MITDVTKDFEFTFKEGYYKFYYDKYFKNNEVRTFVKSTHVIVYLDQETNEEDIVEFICKKEKCNYIELTDLKYLEYIIGHYGKELL